MAAPQPTTNGSHAAPPAPDGSSRANLAVEVNNLDFSYDGSYYGSKQVLTGLNMHLARGSRCLLIGANGAGKSTLLRILGGKHLTTPDDAVRVLGRDAFRDMKLNMDRAYLDTNWGMRTVAFAGYGVPLQADIEVGGMMSALQAQFPERRDELVELLGIDPAWRMHMVRAAPTTLHFPPFPLSSSFSLLCPVSLSSSLSLRPWQFIVSLHRPLWSIRPGPDE